MKLPRFQLHLSTCIVLMFVAGGLMWANVTQRRTHEKFDTWYYECGWPATSYVISPQQRAEELLSDAYSLPVPSRWRKQGFAINIATAIAILFAVAFACEWIIRRRNPRAKSQEPKANSQQPFRH